MREGKARKETGSFLYLWLDVNVKVRRSNGRESIFCFPWLTDYFDVSRLQTLHLTFYSRSRKTREPAHRSGCGILCSFPLTNHSLEDLLAEESSHGDIIQILLSTLASMRHVMDRDLIFLRKDLWRTQAVRGSKSEPVDAIAVESTKELSDIIP